MSKDESGYLNVIAKKENEIICCLIDDNGIGRETSKQNKFKGDSSTHKSKGVHLTQSRLDPDNLLNARNASLEIIDKINDEGKSTGWKCLIILTSA
jgi:hypothetical protein